MKKYQKTEGSKVWYVFASIGLSFVSMIFVAMILAFVQETIIRDFFSQHYQWFEENASIVTIIISFPIGFALAFFLIFRDFTPEYYNQVQINAKAKSLEQENKLILKNLSNPEEVIRCPKCKSAQLTANKKGFGLGKAAVGGLLTGGVGLLGGFIGSGKVKITCLKCGNSWIAGRK